MRRKVIQIAESTQLISLPRKWCLSHNIKKGDELSVEEDGTTIHVSCKQGAKVEKAEINLHDYGLLSSRMIYALYKKGVDEVRINFGKPEDIRIVQEALKNETVGFEVVEHSSTGCLIKNVSGHIEGFDSMLRRTFLLLITMAEECSAAVKNNDLQSLKNLLVLEESNNRFTTMCRRYLNKYGAPESQKIGPLYRIIEELENIADQFKYLFKGVEGLDDFKISKQVAETYDLVLQMIRDFYDSYYKMEKSKVEKVALTRKQLVDAWLEFVHRNKSPGEFLMMHHAITIAQKVFNIIGAHFVLRTETTAKDL